MIEQHPVLEIRPGWATKPANRYQAHPDLHAAVIQLLDFPEHIFIVTDQELPTSVQHAVEMIAAWRSQHEGTAD